MKSIESFIFPVTFSVISTTLIAAQPVNAYRILGWNKNYIKGHPLHNLREDFRSGQMPQNWRYFVPRRIATQPQTRLIPVVIPVPIRSYAQPQYSAEPVAPIEEQPVYNYAPPSQVYAPIPRSTGIGRGFDAAQNFLQQLH